MSRKEAINYIKRIKNQIKREYAWDYFTAIDKDLEDYPKVPNGLSFMAAQAVRFELNKYNPWNREREPQSQSIIEGSK